jgi:hypothetical protein
MTILSELYGNYDAPVAGVFKDILTLNYGSIGLVLGTQKPGGLPQLLPQIGQ